MSGSVISEALGGLEAAERVLTGAVGGAVTEAELLAVVTVITQIECRLAALRTLAVNGVLQRRLCATEAELPFDASDVVRERKIAKAIATVTTDIAVARKIPGHESGRQVRTAQRLCHSLPKTLEQIASGGLTETRARIIADTVDKLPADVVAEFDELAARDCLRKGDKGVRGVVRGLACRLDPCGTRARNRKAVSERYGSSRPVADGMAQFSVVAPLPQVIAAYSSLSAHAEACRLDGDTRSKAQIIADTAIARLTCGAVQGCDEDGSALRWAGPTVPCPSTLETSPTLVSRPDLRSRAARQGLVVVYDSQAETGTGAADAGAADGTGLGLDEAVIGADLDRPAAERSGPIVAGDERPDRADGAGKGCDGGLAADGPPEAGDPWADEIWDIDPEDGEPIFGPGPASAPRLNLHLILTDQTLLGGDEPALLIGQGPVPAFVARHLAGMSADTAAEARGVIRRYLKDPVSGRLADCDPRVRVFPKVMKDFLLVRDQVCRTPFCDAPIKEFDHIAPYAQGGATTVDNGQGLCLRCNRAKETGDWRQSMTADGTIVTTMPTGAVLHSPEPSLFGQPLMSDPIRSKLSRVPFVDEA